ncbi:Ubiquitin-activating enzyme E1-like protein [Yarrowia sp. B02]|nr:Ubiquitin-activating enzyme E1-like protein [Yarrowia sp. B02]
MSKRHSDLERTFGKDAVNVIASSHVLLVGAGGVGCEMLKNLVLLGFGKITVLDLDTVDLSNLNRQFLFGHEHIKQPKSVVARATAHKFNPHVDITSHLANIITDPNFTVSWYKGFDIVYNALDNLEARRHVNRMCLTANVPLVESGTTGFLGQTQVILAGKTECVDCVPKETPKSFPICTIRSTPSQPVHTVVWAKSFLFVQLFGSDLDLGDMDESEASKDELATLKKETAELLELRDVIGKPEFGKNVFCKIFDVDIARQAAHNVDNGRAKPDPQVWDELEGLAKHLDGAQIAKSRPQNVWSREEAFAVFLDATKRLQTRFNNGETLEFDKDDEDKLDFVVAAATLFATVHHVPTKSKFDLKQIAGNIIPAIATTNAMIAALAVQQGVWQLTKPELAKDYYISRRGGDRFFTVTKPAPPSARCVTSTAARVVVSCDVDKIKVSDLIAWVSDFFPKEELAVLSNKLIYDVDFDDNVERTLGDLGVQERSFVTIMDDSDDDEKLRNLEIYFEPRDKDAAEDIVNITPIPTVATYTVEKEEEEDEEDELELEVADTSKRGFSEIDSVVILDEEPSKVVKVDDGEVKEDVQVEDVEEVVLLD